MIGSEPDLYPFDETGFCRLHALVGRGYAPMLGESPSASIALRHPRKSKRRHVPDVTLWADGSLTTDGLLWPAHYVACENDSVPTWQRFILAADHATFARFAESIEEPTPVDLYLRPLAREARVFAAKLVLGCSLCIAIALPCHLAFSAAG